MRRVLLVAAVSAVLRCINAVWSITYANPDEFWQAPEIAHKLVFGTGYATWEWWPSNEIRSAIHPLLLAACFRLLAALGLDSAVAVSLTPKLVHGLLTCVVDICVYFIAHLLFTRGLRGAGDLSTVAAAAAGRLPWKADVGLLAWACHAASWWVAFAGPRPFINSLETFLTAIGLLAWLYAMRTALASAHASRNSSSCLALPPPRAIGAFAAAGLFAGLAISARPTALILWAFVGLAALASVGIPRMTVWTVACILPGFAAGCGAGALCDYHLYGHWTLPLVNFLRFNLVEGLDHLYGRYVPYWYLYDGLPATIGTHLPLLVMGAAAAMGLVLARGARGGGGRAAAPVVSAVLLPPLPPPPPPVQSGAPATVATASEAFVVDHDDVSVLEMQPRPWFSAHLFAAAVGTVAVLSCAAHKEHRFLSPLMTVFAVYEGFGLLHLLAADGHLPAAPPTLSAGARGVAGDSGAQEQDAARAGVGGVRGGRAVEDDSRSGGDMAADADAPLHQARGRGGRSRSPAASGRPASPRRNGEGLRQRRGRNTTDPSDGRDAMPAATGGGASGAAAVATREGAADHASEGSLLPLVSLHQGTLAGIQLLVSALEHPCCGGGDAGAGKDSGSRCSRMVPDRVRAQRRGHAAAASAGRSCSVLSGRVTAVFLAFVVASNAAAWTYFSTCHQRGPVAVMETLAAEAHRLDATGSGVGGFRVAPLGATLDGGVSAAEPSADISAVSPLATDLMSVHFLMPCHSTPYHASLHHPRVALLQLDCSPLGRGALSSQRAQGDHDARGAALSSETEAWHRYPALLLQAMYGPQPRPPTACGHRAVGSGNDSQPLRRAGAVNSASVSCFPATLFDDSTFATSATAFLQLFGPPALRVRQEVQAAVTSGRTTANGAAHDYRTLPSHIVMFDSDYYPLARAPVREFISASGYALAGEFFHAHVRGDAHSIAEHDPSQVLLFVHTCWVGLTQGSAEKRV